jgi:hypothetical protein
MAVKIPADPSSLKTLKNLEENPKAAIMVYDAETRRGYLFKGACELVPNGGRKIA